MSKKPVMRKYGRTLSVGKLKANASCTNILGVSEFLKIVRVAATNSKLFLVEKTKLVTVRRIAQLH